jgi:hypothetical protein
MANRVPAAVWVVAIPDGDDPAALLEPVELSGETLFSGVLTGTNKILADLPVLARNGPHSTFRAHALPPERARRHASKSDDAFAL